MQQRGSTGVIGTTDASIVVSGVTYSGSFQSIDVKSDVQKDIVRNGVGDTIAKNYYDLTEKKGTFEFVTLQNPFSPPSASATAVVTSTVNAAWNGTWIVEDYNVKNSNIGSQRCTLDLSFNTNVQT